MVCQSFRILKIKVFPLDCGKYFQSTQSEQLPPLGKKLQTTQEKSYLVEINFFSAKHECSPSEFVMRSSNFAKPSLPLYSSNFIYIHVRFYSCVSVYNVLNTMSRHVLHVEGNCWLIFIFYAIFLRLLLLSFLRQLRYYY